MTTQAEKEIRAALKAGPTHGPWFVSGVRVKMDKGDWHCVNRYDEAKKRDDNIACVGFDTRTGLGLADVRYIAACNPVNIASLLSRVEKMEKALAPFAEFRTAEHIGRFADPIEWHFTREQFAAARAALQIQEGE